MSAWDRKIRAVGFGSRKWFLLGPSNKAGIVQRVKRAEVTWFTRKSTQGFWGGWWETSEERGNEKNERLQELSGSQTLSPLPRVTFCGISDFRPPPHTCILRDLRFHPIPHTHSVESQIQPLPHSIGSYILHPPPPHSVGPEILAPLLRDLRFRPHPFILRDHRFYIP